jgi:outer membrane protein TolC
MKKQFLIALFGLCLVSPSFGRNAALEGYIREGLDNNLALKQKDFSFARAAAALKEARGLFLPSVGVEARYSRAGGGRIIDIPIGDLMNPVYGTLNTILQGAGQPPPFPTNLQNERIPFLREREHDTKIRAVQPLFQPVIAFNYGIQRGLKNIEMESRNAYRRKLAAEIRTAYYNYLKTVRVNDLLDHTQKLLEENLRVTRSLMQNQKASPAAVYRAEAEMQAFLQQKAEAGKGRILAASYFNFLLNRPLDGTIETPSLEREELPVPIPDPAAGEEGALRSREELRQLSEAAGIMKGKTRIAQSAFLPDVFAVFDYGYQGEKVKFTTEEDYWMASIIAKWNLFGGFRDKYKIDQARLEHKETEAKMEEVKNQIRLQVREAHQNVLVSMQSIEAAKTREKSARKSFDVTDARFREGMAPQIEFLDARNELTRAEVNAAVTLYDCFIRRAEYENVIGAEVFSGGE